MPLVKNGEVVSDIFVHVPDGAELPEGAAVLVSAARFLENRQTLLDRFENLGVI